MHFRGSITQLDSRAGAPAAIKKIFKIYRKLPLANITEDADIIDPRNPDHLSSTGKLRLAEKISNTVLREASEALNVSSQNDKHTSAEERTIVAIYESKGLPGKS